MQPEAYSPRLEAAQAFAAAEFRGRFRKGSRTPYLTHLWAVAARVAEDGGSEDELIAALLHDWLEDIEGARVDLLEERFGSRVATWVVALSDASSHPKPPWHARKAAYIERMRNACPEVKRICAADKLHNARCLVNDLADPAVGSKVWSRFTANQADTLEYYRRVCDALAHGWGGNLLEELRAVIAQLEQRALTTR